MKRLLAKIIAGTRPAPWRSQCRSRLLCAGALLFLPFTQARQLALLSREYQPENVFAVATFLPLGIQRVAVLPLACEEPRGDLPQGCEMLNPILLAELAKTKKFEVAAINPEQLRRRLGRSNWTGSEVLPADFLESLQRSSGCDAVLFCQLTVFHAYAPISVGWRLKLVDARTKQIVWSADEVFDAGRQAVLNGASRYHFRWHRDAQPDDWLQQNSPRQFGQYAAARLFATLPDR